MILNFSNKIFFLMKNVLKNRILEKNFNYRIYILKKTIMYIINI